MSITEYLFNTNPSVLRSVSERMHSGESVSPSSDEEKNCFHLIQDLDIIGKDVHGSLTSKYYMRNEIWSLITMKGAPSWYITLSLSDEKHPICIYYAGTKESFMLNILSQMERQKLVSFNPVVGAHFFHLMVSMFIKHVLGIKMIAGNKLHSPGIDCEYPCDFCSNTDVYYGMVEQQGCLTLHLHMLIWIKDSFSPQRLQDLIMDTSSSFQQSLVKYLEALHQGELYTGCIEQIKCYLDEQEIQDNYCKPTEQKPYLILLHIDMHSILYRLYHVRHVLLIESGKQYTIQSQVISYYRQMFMFVLVLKLNTIL